MSMKVETFKYVDYNGNERIEEWRFNLTRTEVVGMDLEFKGGLEANLNMLIAEQDGHRLHDFFRKFILSSVGKKSPDGRRFIKSQEIRDEFEQTPAYDELFVRLITDADAAAEFLNGVIPNVPDADKSAVAAVVPSNAN